MDPEKLNEITLRVLTDKEQRNYFKQNPKQYLKENNLFWEDDREIKVYENTTQKKYFVIRNSSGLNEMITQGNLPENYKKFLQQLQTEEFKTKFKKDPKAVLKSFQIDIENKQI